MPVGKGFPTTKSPKPSDDIDPADVNLHLLPMNTSATDTFGVYTSSRLENAGMHGEACFDLCMGDR